MDDDTPTTPLPTFHTQSSKKIAQTLAEGIAKLKCETVSTINNEKNSDGTSASETTKPTLRSEFHKALASSLQELSQKIIPLNGNSNNKTILGLDQQEKRQLVQTSRQSFQEAIHRLKENQEDCSFLDNALKGCLVALRAAEHVAVQEVLAARGPVLQTLAILEKTTTSDRMVLNVKLLGMRLNQFIEICGRNVHDLRGPQRQARIRMHIYVIQRLLPYLVQSMENALQRPKNANDRASRDMFFDVVRKSTISVSELFHVPTEDDLDDVLAIGKFIRTVDLALEEANKAEDMNKFETLSKRIEWLINFAMSVGKVAMSQNDEKDILNGCHHVVNELGNLKKAIIQGNDIADLALAKEVTKDFIEVTEQSVNSALLRVIVLNLSQSNGPLDRLIHAVLSSDKSLPDRSSSDLQEVLNLADHHADKMFHVANFCSFCTNDSNTAQSIINSLHLAQSLEEVLIPACLKLYFSPGDVGARSQLKTLRQLWRSEIECIESCILEIVDPTAFCVIAEAEARRIASAVKKDQYSQDRNFLRCSVSQIVRLCQMAVDFAWKEMSSIPVCNSNGEDNNPENNGGVPNQLPEDHPIIRVERSTWEVQLALKMVIANVEDLHVHKVMIRRVQLMVTCMTAMVECMVEANKTGVLTLASQSAGVKVLTSVSKINISFHEKKSQEEGGKNEAIIAAVKEGEDESITHPGNNDNLLLPNTTTNKNARTFCKSFCKITMNNTIGVSKAANTDASSTKHGAETFKVILDIPFELDSKEVNASTPSKNLLNSTVPVNSRKLRVQENEINLKELESASNRLEHHYTTTIAVENTNAGENAKDLFRKVKLHSDSNGFRSPLKQISNQLKPFELSVN